MTATSVNALTIDPEFSSSITGAENAAAVEGAINTAIANIDPLYSNTGTVQIVFTQSAGSFVSESQTAYYVETYSQYVSLLQSNSLNNPANTTLSTAITNLHLGNIPTQGMMLVTSADARVALGLTGATGSFNSSGTFIPGGGQAYDGVITLSTTIPLNYTTTPVGGGYYSAIGTVEHEIDEILGGGGAGSAVLSGSNSRMGVLDLYRYSAPGMPRASATSGSATSYFSGGRRHHQYYRVQPA